MKIILYSLRCTNRSHSCKLQPPFVQAEVRADPQQSMPPLHEETHLHPQARSELPLLFQPAHHLSHSPALPCHALCCIDPYKMKWSRARLGMQGNFIKKLIFWEVCKPWNASLSRLLPSHFLTHINTTSLTSLCPDALLKINYGQLQYAAVFWLQKRPQTSSATSLCCIFCTSKAKDLEERNMAEH